MFMNNKLQRPFLLICSFLLLLSGCGKTKDERAASLYEAKCTICHIKPEIGDLPKEIWSREILPNMAARMGLRINGYNPLKGLSYDEMDAVIKTGIYPLVPNISQEDWRLLSDYIVSNAPDSLATYKEDQNDHELTQFNVETYAFDSPQRRSYTYLEFDSLHKRILLGDMAGNLYSYKAETGLLKEDSFDSPVVSFIQKDTISYITTIGYLNPSAISRGRVYTKSPTKTTIMDQVLHRPVHALLKDLNNDGRDELVISEFGDLTGELSLFVPETAGGFQKKVLLNQPGTIRVLAKDMDADGREDLVALTSQGDETITILYQKEDLSFEPVKALRFSPVYGTSWFELVDYEGDGDLDIITVHGDNADKSYVQKPYHGMRIHINDGTNTFSETYFHPMNGATRVVASDFDQDGDIDFGLLSTFPDYVNAPNRSFLFLENQESATFTFKEFTLQDSKKGKWFLMDKGDLDGDGDEDIILSSFALPFIKAPEEMEAYWKEQAVDIMILSNKLR